MGESGKISLSGEQESVVLAATLAALREAIVMHAETGTDRSELQARLFRAAKNVTCDHVHPTDEIAGVDATLALLSFILASTAPDHSPVS